MNLFALHHRSESEYCFPIDEHKVLLRFRTARNDDDIEKIEVIYNMCAYFPKKRKTKQMYIRRNDELYSYYEAILDLEIPSYMYLFKIALKDGTNIYYDEFGYHKTINFIDCGTAAFRVPFVNERNILKTNKKFNGDVIYEIFPERFNMGNNDKDKSYINQPWNTKKLHGKDFNKGVFLGGDLAGITAKLDYIKDLGVDTIYLTPINQSLSNHKYNIEDYYKIDSCFGDDETFEKLVNSAHEKGLKIIMDLVFNHSANTHPFFQDVLKNGKNSPYYNFYCMKEEPLKIDGMKNYSFNSVKWMPKLNSNDKEVQDYFAKVGEYYLNRFHVDGFRLDVANEVCHEFWINFNKHVKAIDPDCIIIGENWDNAKQYLRPIEFDGIMNYQFFTACWQYYITNVISTNKFVDYLNWLLIRYETAAIKNSFNLIDSHDTGRFYNFCNKNKDLYLLGVLTLISFVGLPMIYYGDEIFMEGGNDPDNRRGMEWDSKEFTSNYHKLYKDIIKLRKLDAFRSGDINVYEENGLVVIERFINRTKYKVVINKSNSSVQYNAKNIILSNKFMNNTLDNFGFIVIKA